MTTNEEIKSALSNLGEGFEVHEITDAWYSEHTLHRLVGDRAGMKEHAPIKAVRVKLDDGMLELHPVESGVRIRCYCCFVGDPDRGTFPIERLRQEVLNLRGHCCPPWPG